MKLYPLRLKNWNGQLFLNIHWPPKLVKNEIYYTSHSHYIIAPDKRGYQQNIFAR